MPPITGLICAGGLGRRMGNADKGLLLLHGRPLVQWAIERLAPQVDEILISANRNIEQYARFGCRVIPDRIAGFAGPLAGLQSGLAQARHDLVATVPCDSPFFPPDLVECLRDAVEKERAQLAVATTAERPHPVFCLCRRDVAPHLTAFLESGGREVGAWQAALRVAKVAFADEAAFANINTPEELSEAAQANRLGTPSSPVKFSA